LDSLGRPDPNAYNVVHWDGTKWELKRINVNFRGNIITPPLEGVFAFSGNDIWFVGSLPIHGDGNNWIIYDLRTTLDPNISVSRCWGSSSNDMYFVGRNGNIAHWDGVKWTKIESGTGLVIGDIWGIENKDGRYNKYLAAGDVMIILNGENKVNIVYPEPNMFINSIWGITNNLIYTAGNGIILFKNNEWEEIDIPELNTVYSIKGNNFNNVFGISSVFSVVHFNGFSWQFINRGDTKIYFRLGVKNDLAIAVGWQGDRAALTLLRRIN
ncbi:MAG: glucosyl transferase, partial [Ignavibacterium sp.]